MYVMISAFRLLTARFQFALDSESEIKSRAKCSTQKELLTKDNFDRILSCKSLLAVLVVNHVIALNVDQDSCQRKPAIVLLGARDLRVHVARLQNEGCYRLRW